MMKVSKWGNSLAIRIPADVAERLGVKEGDELVEADGFAEKKQLLLEREKTADELWVELTEIRKRVKRPEGYKFNREEANSRGR
jgi:antitoxin MazE